MAESHRISVRIGDLEKRFERALETTHLNETTFVLTAVEALVEYVEAHGEITLPIVVTPRSQIIPGSKVFKYPEPPEHEFARAAELPSAEKREVTAPRRSTQYPKSARRAKSP